MGANQQMLLASAPPAYTGSLDSFKSTLWSAAGITRLIGAYGLGAALNVRRSSDNATQDIHLLANGTLDTTSLSSFVGANSAYVTRAYDQSGNGNDWIQATAANQPRIVNAGVYDGKIVFNPTATATWLKTANSGSSAVANKSIFRKVNLRSINTNGTEFEYGDSALIGSASGANQCTILDNTTPNRNVCYLATNATGTAFYNGGFDAVSQANVVNGIIFRKQQASAASSILWFQGGAQQTESFGSGAPTLTGNFPAYQWALGARSSAASLGSAIDMWQWAVYDSDQSTNANAINTALA